ncbi:MAG: hypothetical protein HYR88_03315 [Verrucomicrobia bacterium]|nr:hypothetical protein [Verrucomicrobiota bacterium]MBI3867135.1 hypothetical protein [Verrucomicrobiota bacterium]
MSQGQLAIETCRKVEVEVEVGHSTVFSVAPSPRTQNKTTRPGACACDVVLYKGVRSITSTAERVVEGKP